MSAGGCSDDDKINDQLHASSIYPKIQWVHSASGFISESHIYQSGTFNGEIDFLSNALLVTL